MLEEAYKKMCEELKPQLAGNVLIYRRNKPNVLFPDIAIIPGTEWLIIGEEIVKPFEERND